MSSWYTRNFGDAILAGASLDQIKALCATESGKTQHAKDIAVFLRYESEGRLHCEAKVFFTPATIAVAKAVGAHPCEKPSADNLELLAGSVAAWPVFFPEKQRE